METPPPPFRLVAHRGWQSRYPENTLAAYRAAAQAGARWVECDLQLTRDLEPVLFHDVELGRVCGVDGSVFDHRWESFSRLSASEPSRLGEKFAGNPPAHLKDFVAFLKDHPQVRAFVEMKEESLQRYGLDSALLRVLETLAPVKHQCDLISFSFDWCDAVRRRSHYPVGFIAESYEGLSGERVRKLAPEFECVDWKLLPPGDVRRSGAALFCWEVSDAATARDLQARGVDFIETYRVGELKEELESKAP